MTAPTPPNLHQELDALDEIERALARLTTADLEGVGRPLFNPVEPALIDELHTVIPAQAGTHAECDVPTDIEGAGTPPDYGSRRAPGVISANGRNNKHHGHD